MKTRSLKKFILVVLAVLCVALLAFTAFGCGETPPPEPEPELEPPAEPTFTPDASAAGIPDRHTKEEEYIVNFAKGNSPDFYWADNYSNSDPFDCTWRKNNAKIENGAMTMSVTAEGSKFAGAEYRTNNKTSFGYYAVCMKAANCSGIISSFFGYTSSPVWDEIDIEFLGKDMTKVQFNYYTDGVGGHEFLFDLGFDASADYHEYAFDWQPESITWYVDGIAVYRAVDNLPSHPFSIMANVWKGKGDSFADWAGEFDGEGVPARASYRWIACSEVT